MLETSTLPFLVVPITKLQAGRYQVRKSIDPEKLKGLADSLKLEGDFGVIVVRRIAPPNPDPAVHEFEIVAGERRWRAHQLIGTQEVAIRLVEPVSEAEVAVKGLLENTQREDLDPIEEAEGFAQANRLDPTYWTHDAIADAIGKPRSYVTASIGLLRLPENLQINVRRRTLSRSHAVELCRLPIPELQVKAADQVIKKGLNREQTRKLVDAMLSNAAPETPSVPPAKMSGPMFKRKKGGVSIKAFVPDGEDPAMFFNGLQAAYTKWNAENPTKKPHQATQDVSNEQMSPSESKPQS
jgi:ParB family chromosome partitioning protein